jgi:GNAT superfamily N-acetyltransferase
MFEFLLHGLGSYVDVKETMTALCRTDATAYSSRYFTLAVEGERVVGGFNALPYIDMARLDRNLVAAMQNLHGFGPFPMIRWFVRRIRLAHRSKAVELPPNSLILANIAVFPSHRGQGIGTALLRRFVAAARTGSFESACLLVWQDRQRAIDLYEREGFRLMKTVPFRPHRRLPHRGRCLMQLALGSDAPGRAFNA